MARRRQTYAAPNHKDVRGMDLHLFDNSQRVHWLLALRVHWLLALRLHWLLALQLRKERICELIDGDVHFTSLPPSSYLPTSGSQVSTWAIQQNCLIPRVPRTPFSRTLTARTSCNTSPCSRPHGV